MAPPARLGIAALMNTEFLDEAGTGLSPWARRGSPWQEGRVTVTLQNCTAAGSQDSSPSQLTEASGPPLPSKHASHVQMLSPQTFSAALCWTLRAIAVDVPVAEPLPVLGPLPGLTFLNVPIFTLKSKSLISTYSGPQNPSQHRLHATTTKQ